MKKLTVNEQEELFAQDCKLINLRYEYSGFTGTEKWAIITELSEEALWDKYPDVISRYTPFILLSMAQGEVISESHRNNDKYEKRSKGGLVSGWKQGMKSVSNNEWREVSRSHSKLMAANIGEWLNFRRHKQ